MVESGLSIVQPAGEIPRLVNIEIAFGLRRQALRTADKHLGTVQRKQIRAFPHIAEVTDAVQL
ncbi:hypothetical protein D3C85_1918940 [compost metagenome]